MPTVLVIEDRVYLLDYITDLLEDEGYTVLAATNARQGLNLARARDFHLVLCDAASMDEEGGRVLTTIQADPELEGTPFLFLVDQAELNTFHAQGHRVSDACLVVPFLPDMLIDAVGHQLRSATLHEQVEERTAALSGQLSGVIPRDLRTPLATLLGYASLLREERDRLTPEVTGAMLDAICDSGARLGVLVGR